MIEESRGQQGKVKRPVNQFPWELHVTLASDLSVYNVEAWERENPGKWWRYLVLFYQNYELKPGGCCCWWCVVCSNYLVLKMSLLFHITADTFNFLINLFNHIFFYLRTSVFFVVGICFSKHWSTQPGAAALAWLARGKENLETWGEPEDVELNLKDKYLLFTLFFEYTHTVNYNRSFLTAMIWRFSLFYDCLNLTKVILTWSPGGNISCIL